VFILKDICPKLVRATVADGAEHAPQERLIDRMLMG
jgi:hypothetical protein